MAEKRPLANYSGKVKEVATTDTLPNSVIKQETKGEIVVSNNGDTWSITDAVKDDFFLFSMMMS